MINEEKSILFIDDEKFILDLVVRIFKTFKISCTAVSSAEGSLHLNETSFTHVIIDYNIFDADIVKLIKTLRDKFSNPFIIITSGDRYESLVEPLRSDNTIKFLKKPFTSDEILKILD